MMSGKKIYDPVHRFIHLSPLEHSLIETRPFQRLHYIHQLGVTFFVYPGAVHRRFEHSLGAMELATRIYDEVTNRALAPSLSEQVRSELSEALPEVRSKEHRYWRAVLRLSALCHDLGHLPFSHVAEKRLLQEGGHERWSAKIIKSDYLAPIFDRFEVENGKTGRDVKSDVIKIALGKKTFSKLYPDNPPLTAWESLVSEMLTGDFFGSDRIDYLLRDSKCSGLVYGFFDYHQLFEMLQILPSSWEENAFGLGIEENGIEACEGLLLSRHYMYKRLYQYPTVKAYSFHLARFMETIYYDWEESLERYIGMTDNEVLAELNRASTDRSHPGHFDAKCLYLRDSRFYAIALKEKIEEEELEALREKLSLAKEEMDWELSSHPKITQSLSFPLLRSDGTICLGDQVSEVSIPASTTDWIFVSPHRAQAVLEALAERCSSHP